MKLALAAHSIRLRNLGSLLNSCRNSKLPRSSKVCIVAAGSKGKSIWQFHFPVSVLGISPGFLHKEHSPRQQHHNQGWHLIFTLTLPCFSPNWQTELTVWSCMIHLSYSMRKLALRHLCAVVQPKCETRRCSCVGQCQETTSYGCSGHLENRKQLLSMTRSNSNWLRHKDGCRCVACIPGASGFGRCCSALSPQRCEHARKYYCHLMPECVYIYIFLYHI